MLWNMTFKETYVPQLNAGTATQSMQQTIRKLIDTVGESEWEMSHFLVSKCRGVGTATVGMV